MILDLNNSYKKTKTLQLKKLSEIRTQLARDANKISGLTPDEIEKKMFNKKYASKLNLQSVNDLLNYKNPTKRNTKRKPKPKTPKYKMHTQKKRHSKFKQVKIPKIKMLTKTKMKKKMKKKTLKMK